MQLNHHCASVLPFHLDDKGQLLLILEQKDPGYKVPFFDNGLNCFGGNWSPEDESRAQTIERELQEEFWERYEAPEDLNELLGEDFLKNQPTVIAQYDSASIRKLSQFSTLMYGGEFAANYAVSVVNPVVRNKLTYGSTVFTKELSADELLEARKVVDFFNGKLTTDNLKWEVKQQ